MCLVFRDSQLSAGFFTEPLVACKSRASTDYRASPWENRQRRKYACLQRNLSFFAVCFSLPCLVHPTLLEKSAMSCMTLFRHKKSPSVSRTALPCLGWVWNWKVTFGWRCAVSFAERRSSLPGYAGSDRRFDLNSVVAFVLNCICCFMQVIITQACYNVHVHSLVVLHYWGILCLYNLYLKFRVLFYFYFKCVYSLRLSSISLIISSVYLL